VYLYCVHGLPEVLLIPYNYFSDGGALSNECDAVNKLVDNLVLIENVGDVYRKAVSTN
jgi:hypothetical protein